jgi:hypothetical protein
MARGNGSTSSNNRMGRMVEKVTVYKDKTIKGENKIGPVSAIRRKEKTVSSRRAKRMVKRGWEYGTAKSARWGNKIN